MAEMTPEREGVISKLLGFHDHALSRQWCCQWCGIAAELLAALRAERDEVAAYAAHEEQTHRILGAILGTDDSLEVCARRMKERAEQAETESRALVIERDKIEDRLSVAVDNASARAERAEELLKRVPQAVDFLVQHRTLLHLRDTLRSLEDQADSAIHDAVEPSRLADIERDRDALTREVERLRSEVWTAHVPVTDTQHDPARGLIHGCCERCRMPWPCDYSPERALTPPSPEER